MHTVEEAMTSSVITVPTESTVTLAARVMCESGVSGLPVVDREGRVVGIVTEADLLHRAVLPDVAEAAGRHASRREVSESTVGDVMSRDVVGVRRHDPLAKAARLMETARVRRLVVVGDDFTLEGVISRSDVVAALARPDRDIEDEIRSQVVDGLLGLEPQAVTVSVEDGIVTLVGSVTHRREAARLQRLASRVLGVSRVDSSVTWHADDLGFAGRVPRFGYLARQPELSAEAIPAAVEVDGPPGREGME
jgi:CBS domain-containing protein